MTLCDPNSGLAQHPHVIKTYGGRPVFAQGLREFNVPNGSETSTGMSVAAAKKCLFGLTPYQHTAIATLLGVYRAIHNEVQDQAVAQCRQSMTVEAKEMVKTTLTHG